MVFDQVGSQERHLVCIAAIQSVSSSIDQLLSTSAIKDQVTISAGTSNVWTYDVGSSPGHKVYNRDRCIALGPQAVDFGGHSDDERLR